MALACHESKSEKLQEKMSLAPFLISGRCAKMRRAAPLPFD
jgi:hypothetical protein